MINNGLYITDTINTNATVVSPVRNTNFFRDLELVFVSLKEVISFLANLVHVL